MAQAMTPRQRTKSVIVGAVIASALLLAIFVARGTAGGLGDQLRRGLSPLRTLAAMIAERSPGDRPEGALASLKHRKQAVLSDHLAPAVPASPLAALLTAPPEFVAPPITGPFYSLLGAPGAVVPPIETGPLIPPVGGSPGIIVPAAAGGG